MIHHIDHWYIFLIVYFLLYLYLNRYNYYFLKSNQQSIIDMAEGSVQQNLNRERLNSYNISIPKNKKLITELEPKFAQIEQLKLDIQDAETRFEQYIEELGNEAIKK